MSSSSKPSSPPIPLTSLLLRLPRELRDQIYTQALAHPSPINLGTSPSEHIPALLWKDPILRADVLPTYHATNTFWLYLDDAYLPPPGGLWSIYSPIIPANLRKFIVRCRESSSPVTTPREYETMQRSSAARLRWTALLALPRLTSLAVCVQKAYDAQLFAMDIGPVLHHLRTLRPRLTLSVHLSFDDHLQAVWDDDIDPLGDSLENSVAYRKMGYVDVTDLFDPPTDEDRAYVDEYLPERTVVHSRSAIAGMLDETPANRRLLARHYAVKEPALFRVLMWEQFEVYMEYEEGRAQGDTAEGG